MKHRRLKLAVSISAVGLASALIGAGPASAATAFLPDFSILDPTQSLTTAANFKAKDCTGIGAKPDTDGWRFERPFPNEDIFHEFVFNAKNVPHVIIVDSRGVREASGDITKVLMDQLQKAAADPTKFDLRAALKVIPTQDAPANVSASATADSTVLHTPAGWTLTTALSIGGKEIDLTVPGTGLNPKNGTFSLKAVCLPGKDNQGGTNPGGTNPGGTNPGGTNPGGTNPGGTKPGGTNPGGTNPGGTKPGGTKPGGTNTGATNTGATNTAAEDPGANSSGTGGSTAAEADGGKLPLTGTNVAIIAVAGTVLVGVGVTFIVITIRRRRATPTFTA